MDEAKINVQRVEWQNKANENNVTYRITSDKSNWDRIIP